MEEKTSLTPVQLLDYCVFKLRRIPYDMDHEETIGKELKDVAGLLSQLKSAICMEKDDV